MAQVIEYFGEFTIPAEDSIYRLFTTSQWVQWFIQHYGQMDGSHHKLWVLDQVARIINGTPVLVKEKRWSDSVEYEFCTGEPTTDYLEWRDWMKRNGGYDDGVAP